MNNIYDVILNFLNNYYEVYEWKNTDDIINVRKIPFFKVDDNTYLSFKENKVKIKKETLDTIKYNCLMYGDEDINDIMCLITNGKTAMGVVFDLEGNVIKKSSMLFDEEEEVILESRNLEEMKISFIVNENSFLGGAVIVYFIAFKVLSVILIEDLSCLEQASHFNPLSLRLK